METDTVNSKRPLAEAEGSTEMDIVGVGASPKKLRRMVESSDEEMTAGPTTDITLTESADVANGTWQLLDKKKDKGRGDQYQFERVVVCIQNIRDIAKSLQPGYQLTTKIYRDPQGRYNIVAEEEKSSDYHCDIKHPFLNKPTVPKAPKEGLYAELNAKLDRVQALARHIISSEHITIRLVNDSGENVHLLVNFAQSSKSASSSTAAAMQPVKEKSSKK
ncbi:hypothetical protein NliqN6_5806 [Naganishia liquefaciens]|uniref:Uncharacterized protein n=1 Tax=Naganishia liquefaciens TaxID=104408 RepID=A0A8H3U093_9TREE|nr:hypothetical protein NliqN6_5806 [Naganishia liquefaciens]